MDGNGTDGGGASPAGEGEGQVPVGGFPTLAEAEEYALVVLAMGLECAIAELEEEPHRFAILARESHAGAIRREFGMYARENAARGSEPERWAQPAAFESGLALALAWLLLLFAAFHFQNEAPGFTERFDNSGPAVFARGEWWRPVTALFLHASVDHLLGNAVYGVLLFVLVAISVGPWKGWVLILSSGAIGNLLSAWVHYPAESRSLGASTATFGAIGLLAGLSTVAAWQARSYHKLRGVVAPAGAGVLLLGWLGAGEAPTDVLGHLFGFTAGFGWGCAVGLAGSSSDRKR